MNEQRVLYAYCLALAIDEVVGGFVAVVYFGENLGVDSIIVVSSHDVYLVNPFNYNTGMEIFKINSLEEEFFNICAPRLVQVSDTNKTFKELVAEGLEEGMKMPSAATIKKFLKLWNDVVGPLTEGAE